MNLPSSSLPNVALLLEKALSLPDLRIQCFDLGGRRYWVKRPEKLSLRLRLQKGDSARAFATEADLLMQFAAHGAPVPRVAARSPELLIMEDSGAPISRLIALGSKESVTPVLTQAARTLAQMHAKGLAHGRPRLRDICWDGVRISFVDLEAGAMLDAPRWRRARDLLIFLHSLFQSGQDVSGVFDDVIRSYAQADAAGILPLARKLARRARPLRLLVGPLARRDRRRQKHHSEFTAFGALLDALG